MYRLIALFVIVQFLNGCASIVPSKKPSYCQSDITKTEYNMYQTQSDASNVDVANAQIIGGKILPDNTFESVTLTESDNKYDKNKYYINFSLKNEESQRIYQFTTNYIGKTIGITANRKLITNATIQSPFGNYFQTGFENKDEALQTFEKVKYINCQK